MKLIILLTVLSSGVSSAHTNKNKEKVTNMYQEIKQKFNDVSELTIDEVKSMASDIQLIDVRPVKERKVAIIPGAISKEEFENNFDKYKNKKIVAYCTIGYRSAQYVRELQSKNIKAYNLEGSLLGWVHDGQNVVSLEGKPVKKIHVYGSSWNYPPKGFKGVYGRFFN